jgi:5'-3' exonuclease
MNLKNLNPIIDGDLIVYRCGFSVKEHEPESHALQNVKSTLNGILDQFPERKWYKLYLSGTNNFREELATIKGYKANRADQRKPRDYDLIRKYLIEEWEGEVVDWIEADDAVGIEQFKHKDKSTCLVSNDKDLNQIPGWHFNWVKNTFKYIDFNSANINFWRQMLEGDSTDNIPGITGVGPKTAQKIIDECHGDLVRLREEVRNRYRKQYGESWQEAYEECAGLLWIQRETNQRCPLL